MNHYLTIITISLFHLVSNMILNDNFYFCQNQEDPFIRLDSYNCLKNNSKINNYYRTAFVLEKKNILYMEKDIFVRCNMLKKIQEAKFQG